MKIALVCDHLLSRDHSIEMVELLCEVFEEAKIYTLAHNPGKILGLIEMRNITSTYLSKVIKTPLDLNRKSFLIPSALKTLKVESDTDLVISLSKGHVQGISIPKNVKHICYLYSLGGWHSSGSLGEKFFSSFLKGWRSRSFSKIDKLLISSNALKEKLSTKEATVIHPVFKIADYRLVEDDTEFPYDYYAVDISGLERDAVKNLITTFEKLKTKATFLGPYEHLEDLKGSSSFCEFWGERCPGDLAVLLSRSRAFIDLKERPFPFMALASVACGRPFLVRDSLEHKEFLKEENGLFRNFTELSLEKEVKQMDRLYSKYSRKKLRNNALHYGDMKFRSKLKEAVSPYLMKGEEALAQL
jgi:hypothetical protein